MCEAINGIGSDLSAVISVNVDAPPRFTESSQNQTARLGESVELKCEANGDKPIGFKWAMDYMPLDTENNTRYKIHEEILPNGVISTLTIKPTQLNDSAKFYCFALNAFGSDGSNINLLVQEEPKTPLGFKVVDKSSRMVRLGWTKPHDGYATLTYYIIDFKTSEGSWENDINRVFVYDYTNEAKVSDLSPGTVYDFRIVVKNELGVSDPSEVVSVITLQETPSDEPQHVHVEATSLTSLRVTWDAPKFDMSVEPLGFHIRYRNVRCPMCSEYSETVEYSKEEDKVYSLEITNLKPYTKYGISIQAYNAAGAGPWSDEIKISLDQNGAEDKPDPIREVMCKALTSQTIRVQWLQPWAHGYNTITGYKVIYAPTELWHDENEKMVSETKSRFTILDGLKKYTNYTIQVLSTSNAVSSWCGSNFTVIESVVLPITFTCGGSGGANG